MGTTKIDLQVDMDGNTISKLHLEMVEIFQKNNLTFIQALAVIKTFEQYLLDHIPPEILLKYAVNNENNQEIN